MSTAPPTMRIRGSGARLGSPAGSLPAGQDLDVAADAQGLTLSGGDPIVAWQLPFSTLHAPRAKLVGEWVEITGWVSGTHFLLTVPSRTLEGGTPGDLVSLVTPGSTALVAGPHGLMPSAPSAGRARRRGWLVALVIVLVAIVVGVIVAALIGTSKSTPKSSSPNAQASALAASKNLRQSDVPSSWGQDSPTTSPLSGLLGTGAATKQTAQEKKIYDEVVSEFQQCMGESSAKDRIFGAAGVLPEAQRASVPYGTVIGSNLIEVGSVTQIYASTADVHADLVQMKSAKFSSCFAQTMGRFVVVGSDPTQVTATPPVVVETPRYALGAYVAGASATLQYPTTTGTVPMEIGTSIVISGRYEQTIYTFASPGVFPAALRQQIESVLAARLVGISGATNV